MMRYAPLADTRLGAAVFGFPPYAAKPMRRERVSRRGPSGAGERAARALTQERPEHYLASPFKVENRSGQPQARGAAPELRPPARPPRPWEAFHSGPIRGTQPGSQRPIEQHSAAAWQGSGGAEPPEGAHDTARCTRRERAGPARAVPATNVHRRAGPHTPTLAL